MKHTTILKSTNLRSAFRIAVMVVLFIILSTKLFATAWATCTVDNPGAAARRGGCTGTYTFTLKSSNTASSAMVLNAQVTITFPTDTDVSTCTGGTHNGTAIGALTFSGGNLVLQYLAPVAVAQNVSFTIILNGITHAISLTGATINVDVDRSGAGSNVGDTGGYNTGALTITPSAGSDQNVCNTATLAGSAPGGGQTGVWSLVSGTGTITTPSSNTSGLTALGAASNTFRWTVSSATCRGSDDVIINNEDLSSGIAYSSTYCPASTTSATLGLVSITGTFQWQKSNNGGAYANIAGATTNPYNATGLTGTNTFRVIATTTCGTYTVTASGIVTPYGMKDYTGGQPSYATSNAAGSCYNNLTASQKYCFAFIYSDDIELMWSTDGSCASCAIYVYTKTSSVSSSPTQASDASGSTCSISQSNSGNCGINAITVCSCAPTMYDNACGVVKANGYQLGSDCASPAMTPGNVYYMCFTVPAGCGGMSICPQIKCTSGNCGTNPLPIELLYFNAEKAANGQVQLKWATATETNNDYFTIERSSDAQNFTFFGTVAGAGNSNAILNYSSIDENPLEETSYYRLKQTDYDGHFAFSRIVSIEMASNKPLKLIYVAPTFNNIQYQFSYTQNNPLLVEVLDIVGNKILFKKTSSDNNGQVLNMDSSDLSKGVYFLKISDGVYSDVKKFVY